MANVLRAARLAPVLRTYALQRPPAYVIGERSMTNFKDKERGEETVHFRKADEELLRKLLQKVHSPHHLFAHLTLLIYVSIPSQALLSSSTPDTIQLVEFSMQVKAQADSTDSTQAQESAKSELQSLKACPTVRPCPVIQI